MADPEPKHDLGNGIIMKRKSSVVNFGSGSLQNFASIPSLMVRGRKGVNLGAGRS